MKDSGRMISVVGWESIIMGRRISMKESGKRVRGMGEVSIKY